MLQSIGMTNKQTKIMLLLEGLTYTLLAIILTFTIGLLIEKLIINGFTSGSSYMNAKLTVFPSLICLPILILITVLSPLITANILPKQTIVERLRKNE